MAERKVNKKATGTSKPGKAAGRASQSRGRSSNTKGSGGRRTTASNVPAKMTKEQIAKQERIEKNRKRINHLIMAVVLLALSGFLFISMYTQVAGIVGRGISFLVLGLFGYTGYILPIYFIIYSILLILNKGSKKGKKGTILFTIGFFVLISATYSIGHLGNVGSIEFGWDWLKDCFFNGTEGEDGGFIGMLTAFLITKIIGKGGAYIAVIACMLIAILVTMNRPFAWLYNIIVRLVRNADSRRKEKAKTKGERETRKIKEKQLEYDFDDEGYGTEHFPKESVRYEEEPLETYVDNRRDNKKKILGLLNIDEKQMFKGRTRKASVDYRDPAGEETEGFDSAFTSESGKNLYQSWLEADNKEKFFEENADAFMPEESQAVPTMEAEYEDEDCDESVAENKETARRAPVRKTVMDSKELEAGIAGIGSEIAAAAAAGSTGKQSGGKITPKVTYKMPPINLLKTSSRSIKGNEAQELGQKAMLLENTLKSFNVNAKVVNVSRGPAVTRFEIQPATGVKVSSIVRLQDDIALNLEARSLRMEAPIPGKAAVGIEIENNEKQSVLLRDVVESREFKSSDSKITFAVGRDISGNSIVADLQKMPHLLIAGSTGSGKSVCINSIVMSLLYKAKPDEVKMIMVDPKVVELSNYNGIPHLLIPVVTEASKAAVALNWAVKEMEERYQKFYDVGVRKLESYNRKAENDDSIEKIPQIVIIIDELADLMMAAPQQVEDAICRLAQKARAAGMHLIVATQRPSVDVITGLIKANVPSRMAFAVSSQIDSRTILDSAGAEKLVGNGDMLFNPVGMGKPIRVQGTFVSDEEVQSVIDFVSNQGHEQEFSNDLMDTMESNKMTFNEDETDELLMDAIEHVVEVGHASSSMLQRRFRIGYNRAARLVDMMEERGIVGPQDGSRQRQVYYTKEELAEMDKSIKNIPEMNQSVESELYHNDDYNEMNASDGESDAVPEEI